MNRRPFRTKPPNDIEAGLSALSPMRVTELRGIWIEWFDEDPPSCQSAEFIRRLAAWRLQEERFGGLSAEAKRRLRRLRSGSASTDVSSAPLVLKPGTMIARDWRGKVHRVHVLGNGFAYQGRRYGSLSEIARLITGKRWSGPRFFRVERKTTNADRGADDAAREQAP